MSKTKIFASSLLLFCLFALAACQINSSSATEIEKSVQTFIGETIKKPKLAEIASPEIRKVLKSANWQTEITTSYTQKYYSISYPNGDVPAETGACTDVVIRAFRAASVDLQKEVHEDMNRDFSKYPSKWGLKKTDSNIDHRRVPNLQKFFERQGKSLPITNSAENFKPGDVVTWDLNGKGMTHIGIISNIWNNNTKRYLIFHNIGAGAKLEDRLFDWEITGHYRYF